MLWWKLLLTPLVIAGVTLAGRRWGPRVAGLTVGLPLTSAPVSIFLATERGAGFAARAAVGSATGLMDACCFVAAYALVARRRGWPVALAGASLVLGGLTLLLNEVVLSLPVAVAMAGAVIVLLWSIVQRQATDVEARVATDARGAPVPAWDLPARMLVATVMVGGITAAAALLGPRMSGILSALPVLGGVLAVFTHQRDGRAAANTMIGAMIIGTIPGVLFFAVVGTLAAPGHLAATYAAAALLSVVSSAAISHVTRQRVAVVSADADARDPARIAA